LESSADENIPLIPVFVVPYLIGIVFWIFSIIFINLKGEKTIVKRFNIAIILASILSVLIYIIYPTYVIRPEITSTDVFSNILNFIYANDRVFNAAPSGHTFYTILCLLSLWKVTPKYQAVWFVLSVLIIAATLFTKQHNFLDMIFGFLFALLVYFVSFKIDLKSKAINSNVK